MKISSKVYLAAVCAICCAFIANPASAQKADPDETQNIVKLNVPALILKNVSLQYERAVGKRISVGLGIRFAPKSTLPFKNKFKDLVDDDEVSRQLDNFKTGNFALTPEFRFYVGKNGVFRGFYLAPFVRYATYSGELPYEYNTSVTDQQRSLFMSGRINTFSGGFMLGSQFKLSQKVYFDWWILGASAGSSSGHLNGTSPTPLSEEEQQGLRDALNDLDNDYIKTESTVDASGARVKINGPWYTVRAGLCVGYRF